MACGRRLDTQTLTSALPGSDRRIVTVLFADVSGFTALSARLDPERVTEILNDFFKVLAEPIYRCGGVVDKYMGDALMALFGAPIAHEDDPERAVLAGYELQRAAHSFAAEFERQTGIQLAVRVGINTGLVVAGAVGGGPKREYTVMGDAVNVAQRLEAAAEPGTILVGEETFKYTRDHFEYLVSGPLCLKGLPEPLIAYRLVAWRAAKWGELRDRIPLVGRQSELGRLSSCLDNLREGNPQVIGLIGEAGIGKSRLAWEFIKAAGRRHAGKIIRIRCPSYGHGQSFRMLATLVVAWLGLADDTTPADLLSALQFRASVAQLPQGETSAALLASILELEAGNDSLAERLPPLQRRNAAFLVLNDLLLAEAKQQPLI
ncbi:MAG: AAA family ATPase, partial [Cyanobacteria bacterium NC_groundwater_1444_Ag_S-0.65um_54_12]|nr:AAA family ATPase [Cyanobacteria bacterium NC_groundwater_1444_Ag_S-0.65um_54_12]